MVGDSGIGIIETDDVNIDSGSGLIHGTLKHTSNLTKFIVVLSVADDSSLPEIASETLTLAGADISDELHDFYKSDGAIGCDMHFAQFSGDAGQTLVANVAMNSGAHGYYAATSADLFRTNISFDSLTPVDVKDSTGGTMETATHTVASNGLFLLFTFDYLMSQNFDICTVNGVSVPFTNLGGKLKMVIVPAYTGDVINVKARTPSHGCSYGILKVE